MPSHRLILDKTFSSDEWILQWDEATLSLQAPDGQPAFEIPIAMAHRIIDLHELDAGGKISFRIAPGGPRTFKRNHEAERDMRQLILEGLRTDAPFRDLQKRQARIVIRLGIAAFVIGGGLFALYCWWAIGAPDPPKGSTLAKILLYTGWLIHLLLLLLISAALAGPYAIYISLRQLRRIRDVERTLAD